MKRKTVMILMTVVLGISSVPVKAELEPVETVTEADAGDASSEGSKEAENIVIPMKEGEYTILNETGLSFKNVEYKEEKSASDEKETADAAGDTSWNLILTEDNGTVHIFTHFTPETEKWKEPALIEKMELLYIRYQDGSGITQELVESADEKELKKEVVVYVNVQKGLNLRETPSTESKVISAFALGTELAATAVLPGWVKVKNGDKTGYVSDKYVTTDKDAVDQLLAAQAAARASYSESYYDEPSYSEPSYSAPSAPAQSSGNGIVSVQSYDDCDGSGHGYREITYADGSTAFCGAHRSLMRFRAAALRSKTATQKRVFNGCLS